MPNSPTTSCDVKQDNTSQQRRPRIAQLKLALLLSVVFCNAAVFLPALIRERAEANREAAIQAAIETDMFAYSYPAFGPRVREQPLAASTLIAGLALSSVAVSLIFVNTSQPHWKRTIVAVIAISLIIGISFLAILLFPAFA